MKGVDAETLYVMLLILIFISVQLVQPWIEFTFGRGVAAGLHCTVGRVAEVKLITAIGSAGRSRCSVI